MSSPLRRPELMSPAGGWPQLQTAIECGADAVYFGLQHFSARAKVGFSIEELPEVMATLHARNVKGYVTFNTLVFDHEWKQAETAIAAIADAGVDAVIVQDVGIVELIREMAPGLEIHGSTQMSITSAQGAAFAANLGCTRVVLGRELSLADIEKIRTSTDVELEVFVHGALCVSYSGQCFSSEAWGGRSANRGQCAQACRLAYDLLVDGEQKDLGPYRYLLSPGDLSSIDQVPELIRLGVACFKIEGRYKDAPYVAVTTRAYREAIDLAMGGLPTTLDADQARDLEQIYSRGLGPYFLSGTNHQSVVDGRAPRHRGLRLGEVIQVKRRSVVVEADHEIRCGDGLVFDAADWRSPDEPEEGGRVYEVKQLKSGPRPVELDNRHLVELEFGHGDINFERIRPGDLVWRTHDPQLIKRLKPVTQNEVPVFTRPVFFSVNAQAGQPLQIVARLESGATASFVGEEPLSVAGNRPLDLETLNDKLGRLGGTPYHLGGMDLETSGDAFVPTSLLNQSRRLLVDTLFESGGAIEPIPHRSVIETRFPQLVRSESASLDEDSHPAQPQLHVLVRNAAQLDAALSASKTIPLASITLDYLELYGLRPAVEQIRAEQIRARVASPRILKPTEQNVIRFLVSLECDILVRSSGLLHDLQTTPRAEDCQLIGDFSLNAANTLSAERYLKSGLTRITPAYDLNRQQVTELAAQLAAEQLEIIAFSHLPVFHTEHCVFCRFLSDGTDNTNCGHPCERHQLAVRDAQGRAHPVMADVGCRNTVFGSEAQFDARALEEWLQRGLFHYRVELVHQSADQVNLILTAFDDFLQRRHTAEQLQQTLNESAGQSTTTGSLFVPLNFKSLVQLT